MDYRHSNPSKFDYFLPYLYT